MTVVWTAAAVGDVEAARDYIEGRNPGAARDVVSRLLDAVAALDNFPRRGRPGRVAKTRELVVPGLPYIVVYRVVTDRVEVLRVLHAARRWPASP